MNDNIINLVKLIISNANSALEDANILMNSNLTDPKDIMSAFQLSLDETTGLMKKASDTIGDENQGYVKDLDNIAVNMASLSAEFTSLQNIIKNNMDADSQMYKDKIEQLRAKAYGGCAACVAVPPSCIAC